MEATNRQLEKLMNFRNTYGMSGNALSQVFGMNREEIMLQMGHEQHRRLILKMLRQFPGMHTPGLRKVKAKYMLEALRKGTSDNGNLLVTYLEGIFYFFYRGTAVYRWDAVRDNHTELSAGAYEGTASTHNQRKEIKKAIENFVEATNGL